MNYFYYYVEKDDYLGSVVIHLSEKDYFDNEGHSGCYEYDPYCDLIESPEISSIAGELMEYTLEVNPEIYTTVEEVENVLLKIPGLIKSEELCNFIKSLRDL